MYLHWRRPSDRVVVVEGRCARTAEAVNCCAMECAEGHGSTKQSSGHDDSKEGSEFSTAQFAELNAAPERLTLEYEMRE
jgi:hypothetical protein